jgi:hypothetical protein
MTISCGRYVRLTTLPPSCAVVMKSGNLNVLEPYGPLQACNGTALLYHIILEPYTCFEQYYAHPQEVKSYIYSIWYRHALQVNLVAVQYTD